VRKCLRVEKTRDGQDTAGQPDETDGDTSCALTHPRSQRINDGDITVAEIYIIQGYHVIFTTHRGISCWLTRQFIQTIEK
jgi:hypothetical protein